MTDLLTKALLRFSKHVPLPHRWSWRIGMRDELAFWDRYIAANYAPVKGQAPTEEGRFRTDPAAPLQDTFCALLAHVREEKVQILDVGSGPLSRVGKTMPGKHISLIATDPLAEAYMRLCRKHGVVPPVPPIACDAEELDKHFAPDSFHLAHANNCLDHAYDPVKAIRNMLGLVKPGCHVYLRHEVNVATGADFVGMHQWNFRLGPRGEFLVSDRDTTVDMDELLRAEAEITSHVEGMFVVNIFRKR
ncbi:MAG: methyltransferase domain-containing protein [Flavobacteriales bacterium]|nr:methyltransferase domain-containing protein [Flavobacteriales bacterium]